MSDNNSVEAKVVVGLDFGTTYSGYAFAHTSKPKDIFTYYQWPRAVKPYCKTLTALYYEPGDGAVAQMKSWGFHALHEFTKNISNLQKKRAKSPNNVDHPLGHVGTFLVRFKLHLASKEDHGASSPAGELPAGFTITNVITDYLRAIGASIMDHIRTKYNDEMTMESIQWCVTVPSIWDDHAKKQMEVCMARAGLIRTAHSPSGSPHPLAIVLEPEAASCYCHRNMPDLKLVPGDRILVADIGGGTADLVVQEWISETPNEYKVKEVTYSSGGLCGGTYLDQEFKAFLFSTIRCLPEFLRKSSAFMADILKRWEEIKCSFGDSNTMGESFDIQLPAKLAAAWEEYDANHHTPPRTVYDELELTHTDIKSMFDPIVEQNLALIADQLSRAANVKVIFVVGGFAGSPYLLSKIKERFLGEVEKVICPVQPGSAVCQGAVMLALNPNGITSRVARKTYGFEVSRAFRPGDPDGPNYSCWIGGDKKCDVCFSTFVKKGDLLEVDQCVTKQFSPIQCTTGKVMKFVLYSSSETDPKYTRIPDTGINCSSKEEASFEVDISAGARLHERPVVTVSMFFGRSAIEVMAVGKNFGHGEVHGCQLPVEFRGDWI